MFEAQRHAKDQKKERLNRLLGSADQSWLIGGVTNCAWSV